MSISEKTEGLRYQELTGKILSACFEVSNELGAGFLESVYQKSLMIALEQKGLHFQDQASFPVSFRGQNVGEFFADLFIEEKVILEIKAVEAVSPAHQAQVINYLKASGIDIGLLVNFGQPKLQYRRLFRPKENA